MPSVTLAALTKRFGEFEAVRDMSLSVERGECYALLGPNGAGKTTTLRMLLGLTPLDAGTITVLGEPVPARAREARQRIGVVPQMDNLDPDFTVAENLIVYGRYFGLTAQSIRAKLPELLAFAGLQGKESTQVQSLSGGMKRRLVLARALINDPELIVLDEPTTGLDPQARHLIWERLRRLTAEGKTLILTTHFMDEAERLATRLAVMDHGRKIAEGAPRTLIAEHIEPHVVEVYGDGALAWADAHARVQGVRVEHVGETVFCYTQRSDALVASLEGRNDLRYVSRPANLEDVFLKLTGRDLRD